MLRGFGADPVAVDVFDARRLLEVVRSAQPQIVMHQLTDLPMGLEPSRMASAIARNARIRDEGTRNLLTAAAAAGARRVVAQSIAWAYAPGPEPHRENDALDLGAVGSRAMSVRGIAALEYWTLNSPPFAGVVLRYGQLYGTGTGADRSGGSLPLHVDAAAHAAVLSIAKGAPGIFNIVEPNDHVSSEKAAIQLGWHADFRR